MEEPGGTGHDPTDPLMFLRTLLKSQYHASLVMLREAIDACPVELWTSDRYLNPFWQVAYHTLYYTHLYLQPSESNFEPWSHHRPGHHRFGKGPDAAEVLIPYSVEEMRSYCSLCGHMVDSCLDRLDLDARESGFSSYRMSKLEHQLVNLRHIQHHAGQLVDRLRLAADRGIPWVGGSPASS